MRRETTGRFRSKEKLIAEIVRLRDRKGMSFRYIGKEVGVADVTAGRLYREYKQAAGVQVPKRFERRYGKPVRDSTAEPQQPSGRVWDGTGVPRHSIPAFVTEDTTVEVLQRNGEVETGQAGKFDWTWDESESPYDIIAFRVLPLRDDDPVPQGQEGGDYTARMVRARREKGYQVWLGTSIPPLHPEAMVDVMYDDMSEKRGLVRDFDWREVIGFRPHRVEAGANAPEPKLGPTLPAGFAPTIGRRPEVGDDDEVEVWFVDRVVERGLAQEFDDTWHESLGYRLIKRAEPSANAPHNRTYICRECGSSRARATAECHWNYASQGWIVAQVIELVCLDCRGINTMQPVEVE